MSSCPYCYSSSVRQTPAAALNRPRPDTFTVMDCIECDKFYLMHASGRCYPLFESDNPDSDGVLRKVG